MLPISEKDFLKQVIDAGHLFGWLAVHFRHALQRDGKYLTPVQADAAGFPDLILVHPIQKRIIWAELKSEKGRVSDKQFEWIKALAKAGQKEVFVWKPSDFDDVVDILRGEK